MLTRLNLDFMNPPTTEEIVGMINLCVTLTDDERQSLILRVIDELETRENRLSLELTQELNELWDLERAFIEATVIPELESSLDETGSTYNEELERIRPQLDRLVEEYRHDTDELKSEYDKAFRQIDLEMDNLLKASASESDAAQIEAIKHQLSHKSSS